MHLELAPREADCETEAFLDAAEAVLACLKDVVVMHFLCERNWSPKKIWFLILRNYVRQMLTPKLARVV